MPRKGTHLCVSCHCHHHGTRRVYYRMRVDGKMKRIPLGWVCEGCIMFGPMTVADFLLSVQPDHNDLEKLSRLGRIRRWLFTFKCAIFELSLRYLRRNGSNGSGGG
jgi:hypothetical protein